MEKVFDLLSDIEEKAAAIVDHTSVEKKALSKELTRKIEKLDHQIYAETKKKLDVIRTEMNEGIELEKKELLHAFEEHMKQLETDFEKNHDVYVESVFQRIINE